MKYRLLFSAVLAACVKLHAQTNTFPASGNVGIGTTSPGANLDVHAPHVYVGGAVGNSNAGAEVQMRGWNTGFSNWQISTAFQASNGLDITPSTTPGGTTFTTPVLSILGNGNVGIGTTSPARILDITSADASSQIKSTGAGNHGLLIIDETGGGGAKSEIRYNDNGSAQFATGIDPADGDKYKISNYINVGTNDRLVVTPGGNVGIGTTTPGYALDVPNGTIHAQGVLVDMTGADYVFAPGYKLMSLTQVEQAIKRDQHLPGIPSAKEMSSGGVSVGDLQAKLLAKVEELTLHVIAQQKELDALKAENAAMQTRLSTVVK